ncbi:hypothetical protein BD311DRAFT_865620, partial [Dichomitus squalens]
MLVCRRFHGAILATQPYGLASLSTKNVHALQQRLSRSGDSLVDLVFRTACGSALPIVMLHTSRIRSIVTIPTFSVNHIDSIMALLSTDLPALEEVHV